MNKTYLLPLACLCLFVASCQTKQKDAELRVWSDTPAYTCVFENQDQMGVTSDIYDGIYEGDALPQLPRVPNPSPQIKRWASGEGADYLHEETNAATGGKYTNPVRLWESDPYPIGNGRMAASVFHGSGRDRYALNEVSYWSGGRNGGTINEKGDKSFNGENGPEATDDEFGGYQPVADFMVDFGAPVQQGTFVREILLNQGQVHAEAVRKGVKVSSTAFCSYPDQVMVLRYEAEKTGALNLQFSYALQRAEDKVVITDNTLELRSALVNGMECVAKATLIPEGGSLEASSYAVQLKDATACTVILAIETNYEMNYAAAWHGEAADARINKRMEAVANTTYQQLLQNHEADFTNLFNRVSLQLPASADSLRALPTAARLERYKQQPVDTGLEETLFNFGRYLMIQTSRPGSLPAGLQGIWNGMVKAPWGNDYHSNINLQMVYWLPEVADLSECHLSLINYLYAMREPNRLATREYLSAIGEDPARATDGWVVYTSHNPFGGHGWQVNLPGSAWYGLHIWEHFAFTQDTLYLKEKAYPMLKELSQYWMQHLKTLGEGVEGFHSNYQAVDVTQYPELARVKAGTLVVPEGWSPEHGPRGEDGVTHDQQIVSELFRNTLKAAQLLQVDKEWADSLALVCERMYQPQIGAKGNLMEWMIDREPETDHRHTSHLFGVYPGSSISVAQTPELAEAARQSLLYRKNTGDSERSWAWTWRCMLWSRLHDGEKAHQMLEGLIRCNMLDNLFTSHKIPLQIDGNYGIAAAMLEMLVQSHEDEVALLPALPSQWHSGKVMGVKLRGNRKLDMEWRNGKVVNYTIHDL